MGNQPQKSGKCQDGTRSKQSNDAENEDKNLIVDPLSYVPKCKPIPQCPICFSNDPDYIIFDECQHCICHSCFQVYIKGILKDITRYPITCYEPNCNNILSETHVRFALSKIIENNDDNDNSNNTSNNNNNNNNNNDNLFGWLSGGSSSSNRNNNNNNNNNNNDFYVRNNNNDITMSEFNELESNIKIWEKFSVLCTMNPNEREECPKCSMIYFIPQRWSNDDNLNKFEWIDDSKTNQCYNYSKNNNFEKISISHNNNNNNESQKQCNVSRFSLFTRRHHCRVCGNIYCQDCSNKLVPLKACSNEMILKHFKIKESTTTMSDNNENILGILTKEQRNLLNDESILVRSCELCWKRYYRVICSEMNCNFEYCRHCKIAWNEHFIEINNNSKNNGKSKNVFESIFTKNVKYDKIGQNNEKLLFIDCHNLATMKENSRKYHLNNKVKTQEYLENENCRQCPGCGIWVSKISGCNHMTHEACHNPLPKSSDNKDTHFCYCCAEILYQSCRKYEQNGKLHFENGIFEPCRKHKVKSKTIWPFSSRSDNNIENNENENESNLLNDESKLNENNNNNNNNSLRLDSFDLYLNDNDVKTDLLVDDVANDYPNSKRMETFDEKIARIREEINGLAEMDETKVETNEMKIDLLWHEQQLVDVPLRFRRNKKMKKIR